MTGNEGEGRATEVPGQTSTRGAAATWSVPQAPYCNYMFYRI